MKKLISQFTSFLSYHNAVPIVVSVLFVGGASAFAATATGVIDVPAAFTQKEVDASALLSADIDSFDLRPTVLGVAETDDAYIVSYSLQTFAPQNSAWVADEKTGEFSVAKDALPDDGLQGYVVRKLKDIANGERAYLARAKEAERKLAPDRAAKPANAFASLVGLALDQIPVPKVEKPKPERAIEPEPQPQPPETIAEAPAESQDAATNDPAEQSTTTTPEIAKPTPDVAEAHPATSTPPISDSTASTTAAVESAITSSEGTGATTATASTTMDTNTNIGKENASDDNGSAPPESTSNVDSEQSAQTETASSTPQE